MRASFLKLHPSLCKQYMAKMYFLVTFYPHPCPLCLRCLPGLPLCHHSRQPPREGDQQPRLAHLQVCHVVSWPSLDDLTSSAAACGPLAKYVYTLLEIIALKRHSTPTKTPYIQTSLFKHSLNGFHGGTIWKSASQFIGPLSLCVLPSVQDMYTRLLSANLDFDSDFNTSFVGNLTNVATLEYFTLTVLFPSSLLNAVSRAWFGCIEQNMWVAVFDENTRFSGHGMLFSWIPRRRSCPWYCCCLVDSGGHLLNTWL